MNNNLHITLYSTDEDTAFESGDGRFWFCADKLELLWPIVYAKAIEMILSKEPTPGYLKFTLQDERVLISGKSFWLDSGTFLNLLEEGWESGYVTVK